MHLILISFRITELKNLVDRVNNTPMALCFVVAFGSDDPTEWQEMGRTNRVSCVQTQTHHLTLIGASLQPASREKAQMTHATNAAKGLASLSSTHTKSATDKGSNPNATKNHEIVVVFVSALVVNKGTNLYAI